MASIRVDHSVFEKTACEIDNFIKLVKSEMKQGDTEVNHLLVTWQGADSQAFRKQWNQVMAKDSTYQKYIDALESYAAILRFAAKEYKRAQADAVNRANSLPR